MKKYKTIFCDIDGTIFKYRKFETYKTTEPEVTAMAKEKLVDWKEHWTHDYSDNSETRRV